MALLWEEVQRCRYETGYNLLQVGAELFVAAGYSAVFDNAIRPFLVDPGSFSSTVITAQPIPPLGPPIPVTTSITVVANPNILGVVGSAVYGVAFQQGSRIVVDVGPNQETDVIVQAVSGLVLTVALALAHGPAPYPVVVQGGEARVRDVFARLDNINAQMRDLAPVAAGVQQADEVKLFSSERGRRGQRNKIDDLNFMRDLARKDLCGILGIPNLWELRGKYGGLGFGGAAQQYEPY